MFEANNNAAAKAAPKSSFKDVFFLFFDKMGMLAVLLLMVLVFAMTSKVFFTIDNAIVILLQVAIYGLMTFAMSFVLISGGANLSAGAVCGLAGMVTGLVIESAVQTGGALVNFAIPLGILAGICTGLVCGLIDGFCVTKLYIVPFIATLGTQYIFRGLCNIISGGTPISIRSLGDFPGSVFFNRLGTGKIFGFFPYIVIVMIVFGLICAFVLKKTRYARGLYATGSNEEAARLSGINTTKTKFLAYIICDGIAACAGVVMTARMASAQVTGGTGYELEGIAAAVIGGVSIAGGTGTIGGAVIGAFIIGVLRNGLNLNGMNTFWQQVVIGIVIIVAVWIDIMRTRRILTKV